MLINTEEQIPLSMSKKTVLLLTGLLLAFLPYIMLLLVPDKLTFYAIILAAPFMLLILFNYRITYAAMIASLFVNVHIVYLHKFSALMAVLTLIAFLITMRKISARELKLPLLIPFSIYFISTLPSLVNSGNIFNNMLMMPNLLIFILLLWHTAVYFDSPDKIKKMLLVFLAMTSLNALHTYLLVAQGHGRVFGFGGIMYGDWAGLALILIIVLFLYSDGKQKLLLLLLMGFVIISFVFTQTRNSWLCFGATAGVLLLFAAVKGDTIFLNRKRMIMYAVIFSFVGIVGVAGVVVFAGNIFQDRLVKVADVDQEELQEQGVVKNSLVSRFFIWHTSINAFAAHPIVGMGVYGFSFESGKYNTLPEILYSRYVEEKTPHLGYLMVLVETGLLGFTGFLVFLFFLLRYMLAAVKLARTKREVKYSMILFSLIVYLVISLGLTDAWLWGQGIIFFGMAAGFGIGNYKALHYKYAEGGNAD